MMDWLRKHKNVILITTVSGFIISTFVGFGLYMTSGVSNVDTVAEVNEEKIPYRYYTTLYNRVVNSRRDAGEELSPETLNQIKQDVIQSLIREAVFHQEAKRYGIQVTDVELAQSLASIPAFQKDGKFNIQAYAQALQYALRTTPEQFEESQRRQIAISRLQAFVTQGIKITDKELEQEYLLQKALEPYNKQAKQKKSEDPAKEKEALREKLRQEKGAQILNRWYQQLGTNLQVKVHLDEIEKRGAR